MGPVEGQLASFRRGRKEYRLPRVHSHQLHHVRTPSPEWRRRVDFEEEVK